MPPNGSLGSERTAAFTKTGPGLQPRPGDVLTAADVRGEDGGAQPKPGVVRDLDRFFVVFRLDDRGRRTEKLSFVRRHPGAYVGEHDRGIPRSLSLLRTSWSAQSLTFPLSGSS